MHGLFVPGDIIIRSDPDQSGGHDRNRTIFRKYVSLFINLRGAQNETTKVFRSDTGDNERH